jgi:hypothetical protein
MSARQVLVIPVPPFAQLSRVELRRRLPEV